MKFISRATIYLTVYISRCTNFSAPYISPMETIPTSFLKVNGLTFFMFSKFQTAGIKMNLIQQGLRLSTLPYDCTSTHIAHCHRKTLVHYPMHLF
jgi:hypothetical protein